MLISVVILAVILGSMSSRMAVGSILIGGVSILAVSTEDLYSDGSSVSRATIESVIGGVVLGLAAVLVAEATGNLGKMAVQFVGLDLAAELTGGGPNESAQGVSGMINTGLKIGLAQAVVSMSNDRWDNICRNLANRSDTVSERFAGGYPLLFQHPLTVTSGILLVGLVVGVCFAIVGKIVPKFNVLQVLFPVRVFAGMFMLTGIVTGALDINIVLSSWIGLWNV